MPPVTCCARRGLTYGIVPVRLFLGSPRRAGLCGRAVRPSTRRCARRRSPSLPAAQVETPPVLGFPPKPRTEFSEPQEQQLLWFVALRCSCPSPSGHAPVPQEPGMLLEAPGPGSTHTQDGGRRNPSSAALISPRERCVSSPPKSSRALLGWDTWPGGTS